MAACRLMQSYVGFSVAVRYLSISWMYELADFWETPVITIEESGNKPSI